MTRRNIAALVVALVVGVVVIACDDDGPTAPSQETFEWRGQIAQGDHIEIKGVIGSIAAVATTGNEVVVTATKSGRRDDPGSVRIDVVPHAEGVTICAVYPDVPGQPANECLPGLAGSMRVEDNDIEVTFEVRLPAGVDFIARTVTGSVTADDIDGNASLFTVTGSATAVTSQLAEATVVTGSITAEIGLTDWGRGLNFTAVTGDVTVEVPAATNADVALSVVTGTVSSAFPLTQISPVHWEGTIGSGGPLLRMETVTGNVRLLRGP